MERTTAASREKVNISLPLKIDYKVLDEFLQKKFQGKILSKGKPNGASSDTARILKISLRRSQKEDFDLVLQLRLKMLTLLLKNQEFEVEMHLAISFDSVTQELSIKKYELDGGNNGWLTSTIIETIGNTLLYGILKNKMKFQLRPLIEEQLEKINMKLFEGMEIKQGVILSGRVSEFSINDVIPGHDHLLVAVNITGRNVLNIKEISF
ncbi:MAG: DUF4403 family protein [Salinimicrobium sp.]